MDPQNYGPNCSYVATEFSLFVAAFQRHDVERIRKHNPLSCRDVGSQCRDVGIPHFGALFVTPRRWPQCRHVGFQHARESRDVGSQCRNISNLTLRNVTMLPYVYELACTHCFLTFEPQLLENLTFFSWICRFIHPTPPNLFLVHFKTFSSLSLTFYPQKSRVLPLYTDNLEN